MTAKLFQNVLPKVKKFIMTFPNSQIIKLDELQQLELKDLKNNLDYLYVVSGSVEIKMKLSVTHYTQSNTPASNQR